MTQISLPRGSSETGTNEWNDVYSNDNAITTVVNGQLSNDNLDANAAIAHSKLANGTSGQLLVANSSGVITSTTVTGDVTISNTGVTAIGSDKVTATQLKDSASVDADRAVTTDHIRDNAITTAKLASSIGGAWTSYTPTIVGFGGTNPSLGNATVSAAYWQLGKTVQYRAKITFGSTTTFGAGAYILSTPVGVISGQQGAVIGTGHLYDSSATTSYPLTVFGNSLGATLNWGYTVSSKLTLNNVSATDPVTLASGDVLSVAVTYEAA